MRIALFFLSPGITFCRIFAFATEPHSQHSPHFATFAVLQHFAAKPHFAQKLPHRICRTKAQNKAEMRKLQTYDA